MLTDGVFSEGIRKLEAAYQLNIKPETLVVYYNALKGQLEDKDFQKAVETCLLEEKNFPSIAKLFSFKGLATNPWGLTRDMGAIMAEETRKIQEEQEESQDVKPVPILQPELDEENRG